MSDTGNQGNQNNQNANGNNQGAEKTFTQEQVDQIVSERLGREKAKYSNYEEVVEKAKKFDEMEEKSKSELEKLQDKYQKTQDKLDALEKENKVTQIRKKVAEEQVTYQLLRQMIQKPTMQKLKLIKHRKQLQRQIRWPQPLNSTSGQMIQECIFLTR